MNEIGLVGIIAAEAIIMVGLVVLLLRRPHTPHPHDGKPAEPSTPAAHFTKEDLAKLQDSTQKAFEKAVEESASGFHADLTATSQQLNKLIMNLTTEVVERELEEYRQGLTKARAEALKSLEDMQTAVRQKQADLQSDVDGELAKRREFLIKKLDQHLGASVAAYIVESLGQGADLGAQRAFLLENLERHKEDLKQEIADAR